MGCSRTCALPRPLLCTRLVCIDVVHRRRVGAFGSDSLQQRRRRRWGVKTYRSVPLGRVAVTSTSEYVEAPDRASGQGGGRRGGVAIALGLALGPAAALGLARFAYALLLPSMRANLGWSFSAAGAKSTDNAVGYLAGPLLGAAAVRRAGARRSFLAGIRGPVRSLPFPAARVIR